MPWFSRRRAAAEEAKTVAELRRRLVDAGYVERFRTDTTGQHVLHYEKIRYRPNERNYTANTQNEPIPEYCGKATCRNPEPRRRKRLFNWFGPEVTVFEGMPEYHYPAVTPVNQTAAPGGAGWKGRQIAEDYIPNTTLPELPPL